MARNCRHCSHCSVLHAVLRLAHMLCAYLTVQHSATPLSKVTRCFDHVHSVYKYEPRCQPSAHSLQTSLQFRQIDETCKQCGACYCKQQQRLVAIANALGHGSLVTWTSARTLWGVHRQQSLHKGGQLPKDHDGKHCACPCA